MVIKKMKLRYYKVNCCYYDEGNLRLIDDTKYLQITTCPKSMIYNNS